MAAALAAHPGCSWVVLNQSEPDEVFQRSCHDHEAAPRVDAVFAGLATAASLGMLITGAAVTSESNASGEGGVVGGIFMGMGGAIAGAAITWSLSADYGFKGEARCEALRATMLPCAASPECQAEGLCADAGPRCIAALPTHCEKSEVCRTLGRCTLINGACAAKSKPPGPPPTAEECASGFTCRDLGLCGSRGQGCIAVADNDCRRSRRCQSTGRCSLGGDSCIAASSEDCQASAECVASGLCVARNGQCVKSE